MGWLQRTFPRIFGSGLSAEHAKSAGDIAGVVFGDPDAKTEAYGLLAGVMPFGLPPRRGTRELLMLYSASPWLRAVVGRIAGRVAQTHWHVYAVKDGAKGVTKPIALQRAFGDVRRKRLAAMTRGTNALQVSDQIDHPMLEVLHDGCPALDGRSVMALTQIYLSLKGEAFWLIERWDSGPKKGLPRYIWPIPPFWVLETPSVARPGYRLQYLAFNAWVPETEIVRFCEPDPFTPYGRSSGVGESLADELSADESASKLVDSSFVNRNLPAAIVSMEGGSREEAVRLKEEWSQKYAGVFKAFQTHFTSSKINVAQLSQTFADMQVLELRKQMRDNILEGWGYPKELLGILDNANRSTIDTAEFRKERYIIEPARELVRHVLQLRFMPEWDERGLVEYDTEVPEDREFVLKVVTTRQAAFTDDEVRHLAGRAPLPDGAGETRPTATASATASAPLPLPKGVGDDPAWARSHALDATREPSRLPASIPAPRLTS